jgi:phosphate transport system substrate-binding protein
LLGTASSLGATLSIVGTGDGVVVLQALAEAYAKKHPGEAVEIPPSVGSGGGIAAVGSNRERMGRVARSLTANELASGIAYEPVFAIPSVFFVHPDVPVSNLTPEQLKGIFDGTITNWKVVGGPDMRIRVVRREDADSTVLVFRATLPAFRDIKFTERSKLALTTQDAIFSVRDNSGAIGFGPYSGIKERELKVISINGVAPTDARYPSAVTIALIYKPERRDADIKRFLEFFALPEASEIIRRSGAIPNKR